MIDFFRQLGDHGRTIAFRPCLVKIARSLSAGVLLAQLLYWHKIMSGREFYKTNRELMDETGLTLTELKSAKKRLIKENFVTTKLRRNPATTHYEIDEEVILKALDSWQESDQQEENESNQLVSRNPTNQLAGITPTLHTEITTKISKKINPKSIESEKKWEEMKELLNRHMLPENFKTWIYPTRGLIVRPDKVLIEVPNRFYKKCLEENYRPQIREALREAVGFNNPPNPEFQIMEGI